MPKLNKTVRANIKEIMTVRIPHHARVIARKEKNDPTLPEWFNKPAAYHEGMLDACYAQIEDMLHGHGVYKGFREYEKFGKKLRWYYVDFLRMPNFNLPLEGQELDYEPERKRA